MLEYLPIVIPSLLGYSTAMFCNVQKSSAVNVAIRPPAIVFSLVWPVLYIFLGISWYISRKTRPLLSDIFYGILICLLSLWIIVYSCKNNKKYGVYVLVLSVMFGILAYTVGGLESRLLIVPLIVWLCFATLLNVIEVESLK